MASAWGSSWGTSWGNAWGAVDGASVQVAEVPSGGGNLDWLRKKKKKGRVIRFSDFEAREQYEAELRMAAMPIAIPEPIPIEEEDVDEDELLLKAALLVMLK